MVPTVMILALVSCSVQVDASPSQSFLRHARRGVTDDFDQDNFDFKPSLTALPRMMGSMDFEDTYRSPLDRVESALFEDLSRSDIPQFGESSLFGDRQQSSMGFRLSGPHQVTTPQTKSVSFQTSSSSSSSFSTDLDGHVHQQVMQERTQRRGNGLVTKSLSASRACVDGDCDMKTIQSVAPVPGVEFMEGVTMRGPQGGALDKRMSLTLGMDNSGLDRVPRKDSGVGHSQKKGAVVQSPEIAHGDGGDHSSMQGDEIILMTPNTDDI